MFGARSNDRVWRWRLLFQSILLCLYLTLAPSALAQQNGNTFVLKPAHDGDVKRFAIVIGNGAYQKVPTLRNPKNDAVAVATKLQQIGYVVVYGHDLDRRGMNEA